MRTQFRFSPSSLFLFLFVLFLCQEALAAGPAAQIAISAGDNQTTAVNNAVPDVVCVIATDAANSPVAGVSVTWGGVTGGGTLTGATQVTDATGVATLGSWTLGPVAGTNTITATSAGLNSVTFTATGAPASTDDNLVIQWNNSLLQVIKTTNVPPPIGARALAMLHTGIFDAWAAYDAKAVGTQLGGTLRRPASEQTADNKGAALSYAAYRILLDLFPSQKARFDGLMAALNLDPTNTSVDASTPAGVGNTVATAILNFRHSDGSNQLGDLNPGPYSDYTSYAPVNDPANFNDPSRWQPLLQANGQPQQFLTPQWGGVTAFAIGKSTERPHLMPRAPAKNPGKAYQRQAQEVLALSGSLDDLTKSIATYWADKGGTVTPPGHWFQFAQAVSHRDNHTLDDDVKLFFALGNAVLDTSIQVWDIKRHYDSVRPVSAIRFLFKGQNVKAWAPGKDVTTISGETWTSYIPTPNFPEYVSGHSTFSGASAQILLSFTKKPTFNMSVTIPAGSTVEPNVPAQPITLSWKKFVDAVNQAGMSRRFGGIHFKDGDLQGRTLGKKIGAIVWKKAQEYIEGKVKP